MYRDRPYPLTAAHRGDRQFVGSVSGTVVGRRNGTIEVAFGDGLTLWLSGDDLDTFRINDKLSTL